MHVRAGAGTRQRAPLIQQSCCHRTRPPPHRCCMRAAARAPERGWGRWPPGRSLPRSRAASTPLLSANAFALRSVAVVSCSRPLAPGCWLLLSRMRRCSALTGWLLAHPVQDLCKARSGAARCGARASDAGCQRCQTGHSVCLALRLPDASQPACACGRSWRSQRSGRPRQQPNAPCSSWEGAAAAELEGPRAVARISLKSASSSVRPHLSVPFALGAPAHQSRYWP